jgi:4-carboxymuconolactone decarboxylase
MERTTEGDQLRRQVQGVQEQALFENLTGLDPRLGEWSNGFIFGEVWRDDAIDPGERIVVALVALAATGQHQQLRNYLHSALQNSVSPARIHESLMMLVIYVGFPVALSAMSVWREVVLSYRKRGHQIDVPVR